MTNALHQKPKAIVVGGSLGGLFAANMLERNGWDVEIFERTPEALTGRGAASSPIRNCSTPWPQPAWLSTTASGCASVPVSRSRATAPPCPSAKCRRR